MAASQVRFVEVAMTTSTGAFRTLGTSIQDTHGPLVFPPPEALSRVSIEQAASLFGNDLDPVFPGAAPIVLFSSVRRPVGLTDPIHV